MVARVATRVNRGILDATKDVRGTSFTDASHLPGQAR